MNPNKARPIKALSIWQPWASLIALGQKKYETRHWQTPYRGLLAIHASKRWTRAEQILLRLPMYRDSLLQQNGERNLPLGQIVCICELIDCCPMSPLFIANQTDKERAFGNWQVGRYAWNLSVLKVLDTPLPLTGRQGLFNWEMPPALAEEVQCVQEDRYADEERRREENEAGYMLERGLVYTDDGGLW